MTETENGVLFEFDSKAAADRFISDVKKATRVFLYISLSDMKVLSMEAGVSCPIKVEDFHYGYNKSDVHGAKSKKNETSGKWEVCFAKPGQLALHNDGFYRVNRVGGA